MSEEQSRKRQKRTSNADDANRVDAMMDTSSQGSVSASVPSPSPSPTYLQPSAQLMLPRVGLAFQAEVSDAPTATNSATSSTASPIRPKTTFASLSAAPSAPSPPIDGTPVWIAQRFRDTLKLENYLRAIDALFYHSHEHFDEEKALELLHRCNYDVNSALELVQPWAKVEEEDENGAGKSAEFDSDDMCSVCGDGGDLIICDAKGCKRVYHAVCAELAEIPSGQWECSVHFCSTCGQRVNDSNSVRCASCPTAYCAAHIPAYARSANQIKHVDFKCPKCTGSRDGSNLDRRGFLTQLMAALSGSIVSPTGKADHHAQPVNLKDLYREITVRGGLEEVLSTNAWREVQVVLGWKSANLKTRQTAAQ